MKLVEKDILASEPGAPDVINSEKTSFPSFATAPLNPETEVSSKADFTYASDESSIVTTWSS